MTTKITTKYTARGIDSVTKFKQENEMNRKISMANKRLTRLENNNLVNTSAYQNWLKYKDGERFSVKGKNYRELQKELKSLDLFLKNESSLVREANKQLKDIARLVGHKVTSVKQLSGELSNLFRLFDKVEEYLRNVEYMASAIGYQKIWEITNNYLQTRKIDLTDNVENLEPMVEEISKMIALNQTDEIIKDFGNLWGDL